MLVFSGELLAPVPTKRLSREVRKQTIKHEVALHMLFKGSGMSMYQIAKSLHIQPSSWLMNLLIEMSDSGSLYQRTEPYKGGKCKFTSVFFIPSGIFEKAVKEVYQ